MTGGDAGAAHERLEEFSIEFEFCPLKVHLLALDKGGKVLWDKTYGNGVERPNHAAVMADGGFLVVGRTWPYNRFSPFHTGVAQQGWAARFSADGELLWERRYSRHGQMAELVWVIALASDLALVSVNHGVPSREHSLLRISLRNGDIVETVVVPGEVGRLERDSHGVWTTIISSLDRDEPGTTFTIDPTTGSLLHPIQEGPATWEDARGGATIMDSVPLMSGGRLLTTILLGKPSKVSLVTTDVSGRAAWRLTLDDPTVSSVLAMTATADGGFIYVAERWEGRYHEGSPLGPRIVRMD